MKKLFFIVFLMQPNLLLCMNQEEKAILGCTALSPKTARAVFATLREDPWKNHALATIRKSIVSEKDLEHFVETQCALQKEFKRKTVEQDAQEYGFKVDGWKITYETQDVGKEKFSKWLIVQLKKTTFFNNIPDNERQGYIEHVIEEYRKNETPSDDDDNGIRFEKLQEHYEVRINQLNRPSLRKSSD